MKFLSQFLSKAAGRNSVNVVVVGKVENSGSSRDDARVAELEEVGALTAAALEAERARVAELEAANAQLQEEIEVLNERVLLGVLDGMEEVLKGIAKPRIHNFRRVLFLTASRMFDVQKDAAEFLGVSPQYFCSQMLKMGHRPERVEIIGGTEE